MSGKGSISRMSDECLITLETVFSFYTQYQAVMRKFTLAGKSQKMVITDDFLRINECLRMFSLLLHNWPDCQCHIAFQASPRHIPWSDHKAKR